jgi:hypothetical protein
VTPGGPTARSGQDSHRLWQQWRSDMICPESGELQENEERACCRRKSLTGKVPTAFKELGGVVGPDPVGATRCSLSVALIYHER